MVELKTVMCGQQLCHNYAKYNYDWPGKETQFICENCAKKLLSISQALGMNITLHPIVQIIKKY